MPTVLGLVSMSPAVSAPTAWRRASTSTQPSGPEGMFTTVKPAMTAEAGLVPWAESGTMILVRAVSFRCVWYALMSSRPVNSPWAPAAGWKVMASMPVISPRSLAEASSTSRQPWTVPSGWRGWIWAKPGRLAMSSLILGLYFMVQEPRG